MREGWKEVTLEEISSKIGDGLHGTPKYDELGEYYFINGNNLQNGKIIINNTTNKISEHEYTKIKKDLNDRTILLQINGTIGNLAFYKGEKIALGKSACYINLVPEVNKYYIRYVLEFDDFQKYALLYATGSTIKNLGLKAVRNYKFNLPPLETQKKIASILSGYDDLIENNLKRIKILEEMAQQTYEEWFVRMRFPGHESATINPETGLPEGWDRLYFKDILNFKTGKLDSNALDNNGVYDFYTCAKEVYKTNTYCFEGEAVLLGGNNATGDFALFYADSKFDAYQRTYIVTSKKDDFPLVYVYQVLRTYLPHFKIVSSGASTKFLTMRILDKTRILVPNEDILQAFYNIAKPCFESILNLQNQNQRLREARNILLPRLMMGMVEV